MFSRKSKKDNKAKLEHKLYLAKETPEPIFDLSECDIREVPQGIYSLCRVFLKERLRLDSNNLTSLSGGGNLVDLRLLIVLNISYNNFSILPEEIGLLTNLQEFHASHNSLRTLPDTICDLKNLNILDVSHNHIKKLPDNIGGLVSLKKFYLKDNNVKRLPTSICQLKFLIELTLDSSHYEYPPEEVAVRGLEALMKYICDDAGLEYIKAANLSDLMRHVDESETHVDEENKFQQNRTRQFLEIERHNDLLQRQELELANAQKLNRDQLLKDITQEQDEFDSRLLQIHQEKEKDRFRLIEQLHEAEQNAYASIEHLLAINREPLASLLEYEKEEEEKLIAAANAHNENLKKTDILEAMRQILEQESNQFQQIYQQRVEVTQSILQREMEWGNKVSELMNRHDSTKKDVVAKLLTDFELQKAALGALLERNDARSWGLTQQVCLVESQLASLTQIELDRRKLQLNEQVNDFAQKRMELSVLLMDLLEQQDIRRSQILDTMKALEANWDKQSQDYWLKQYQALLSRTPEGIAEAQKLMDPLLGEALLMNGVIQYLPHLSKIMQKDFELKCVNEEALKNAGVNSRQDRIKILDAFTFYKKQRQEYGKQNVSAPVEEVVNEESTPDAGQGPSAPPLEQLQFVGGSMAECVICMDQECQVIFVPCGHIICCLQCSGAVSQCPLCRADIDRKIKILL